MWNPATTSAANSHTGRFVTNLAVLLSSACASEPPATDDGDTPPVVTRFEEDFEVSGPPFAMGYPELPLALLPSDGSRWTQIQDDHFGRSRIGVTTHDSSRVLYAFAVAEVGDVSSKMDLGKQTGLRLREGETVRIKADMFVDGSVSSSINNNTLIDLENHADIQLDGTALGPGLRIRTNDIGNLALDRGELVGSDGDEPPHLRLGGFHSTTAVPIGTWFTIEAVIKLGTGVPRSTTTPIDDTFDAASTAAWCELYIGPRGGQRELAVRMQGTTFLDRELGVPLIEAMVPDSTLVWPTDISYDQFQIGLTNNKSNLDQRLLVDNILIETL
jgi:hypothetical protein